MKWYFKDQRLREGSSKYEYGEDSTGAHTLTIMNIQKRDKGLYKCRPKLSVKGVTVEDRKFLVEVTQPALPSELAYEASSIEFSEGETGQINCNFKFQAREQFHGLGIFFWTYNDERFLDENRVHEESEVTHNWRTDDDGRDWLELRDIDLGAAGTYRCNYEYEDGRLFTMRFNIKVRELAHPSDVVRDMNFREDSPSATLICDLAVHADMEIVRFYWEKDGKEIGKEIDDEDAKYVMYENEHEHRLEIKDVNKETDDGIYRCVVQLAYYPIAIRFNVNIEISTKDADFTTWTDYSACDEQGNRFRFRSCTNVSCLERYGYVYEIDSTNCTDEMV